MLKEKPHITNQPISFIPLLVCFQLFM
uniref:Uncharacterized protein n=1 Tax=Rhizophora mucronata TaxID=61149 RepID=A0A2P2Q0B4_RHIMU